MTNNTEKLIKRIDNYLSFTRYGYATMEKLQRETNIYKFYNSKKITSEKFSLNSKIDFDEQLSTKLTLPLKVRGVFLTEGRPLAKYYKGIEMEKSITNPLNKTFPMMLDHKNTEASSIVGAVSKLSYDSNIKGIRWWGHINDETFARNVLDGTITEVSATILSTSDFDDEFGLIGTDLVFKELSLVLNGAEPNNYIEPY